MVEDHGKNHPVRKRFLEVLEVKEVHVSNLRMEDEPMVSKMICLISNQLREQRGRGLSWGSHRHGGHHANRFCRERIWKWHIGQT